MGGNVGEDPKNIFRKKKHLTEEDKKLCYEITWERTKILKKHSLRNHYSRGYKMMKIFFEKVNLP